MDQTQASGIETDEQRDTRLNKDVAAFSYIWAMALVVYAARRDSSFARYHSKQALVLFAASFVWIIPYIGHFLEIFVVAGMVLGFIHAAQGLRQEVPLVGPLSRGEFDFHRTAQEILKVFLSIVEFIKSILHKHKNVDTQTQKPHVDKEPPTQVP